MALLTSDRAIMILLAISVFVLLKTFLTIGEDKLQHDAVLLAERLTNISNAGSIAGYNGINIEKMKELRSHEYLELKERYGVTSDFCIFIEDDKGEVLRLDGFGVGIGSDKIAINGEPCD